MDKNKSFQRASAPGLLKLAQTFPIIAITGPRQSGKTTLAKQQFPDKAYINLEDPSQRAALQADPKGLINSIRAQGAIFDEVQHYPELLSYLQVEVDQQQRLAQFVITGSYHLSLMESVTQSLAGRVGLLSLLPMSTQELGQAGIHLTVEKLIYSGGLPRIFRDGLDPTTVYKNYVQTYLERDMRQVIQVKDLMQFQRFLQLCAGSIGSEFVASSIANEVGVSYHTIQSWLSVLEASYIIFRLPPYFENFNKRIVKSPKLYFTDVGVATYLLGIENTNQLIRDPFKGKLFENLVILDIYKSLLNQVKEARLYFYRDQSQNEVDLIWQKGRELVPIEIKYGQTFHSSFIKGLNYFKRIAEDRVSQGYVIYNGETNLAEGLWKILNANASTFITQPV